MRLIITHSKQNLLERWKEIGGTERFPSITTDVEKAKIIDNTFKLLKEIYEETNGTIVPDKVHDKKFPNFLRDDIYKTGKDLTISKDGIYSLDITNTP